ncbi:MAG TPA: PadR family transcriptional regulator [Gemmatimonadaceae bacterium]|nr:PadR family transcriptional regulator [Gemmatimonadaceae bacterium]
MTRDSLDLLQGTLDLLILRTLAWGQMHGYGISGFIRQRTDGAISIVDAALYKALHRLERDRLIDSVWGVSENNRKAKYYRLTPAGRRRLHAELDEWRRYSAAVLKVVEPLPT